MNQDSQYRPETVWSALRIIYRSLSSRRKTHLKATILLMLAGAVAELITIGAVIPFLVLLADPGRFGRISVLGVSLQDLLPSEPGSMVAVAASALILAATLSGLLRVVLGWVSQRLVFSIGRDLGDVVFYKVLRQTYRFHITRSSSEIISGFDKVQQISIAALIPGVNAFISSVIAILLVSLLFVINPWITLIAAAIFVSLYLLVSITTRGVLRHNSSTLSARSMDRVTQIQMGIGGIRDILLNRSEKIFCSEFHQIGSELAKAQAVNTFISTGPRIAIETVGVALIAILAWYTSGQSGGLSASIPMLGAMALGAQRLLPLLQASFYGWSQFIGNSQAIGDVAELLTLPVPPDSTGDVKQADVFHKVISFEDISFCYDEGDYALRHVNFEVCRGERIGIVGKTGSGKSTLMDLFLGLLEPTAGRIVIDGKVLDAPLRRQWQSQIAHVPQAIYLTENTIAANIAFGEPSARIDMDRVREVARIAGIEDFVSSLPKGFDTRCGERGIRLSGGQRQRIAIARALYKQANVLVFDEATSALDSETEAAVMEALGRLGNDITVLLIAHRLTTLAGCDKILRLSEGRLVDQVTYAELVH